MLRPKQLIDFVQIQSESIIKKNIFLICLQHYVTA